MTLSFVVTSHYVSRTKNKYAKANRIYICPEHFTGNIERKLTTTLQQDDLFKRDNSFGAARGGEGHFLIKRLMGMFRWMGSHFHDWIDYNGVAFSKQLLEWGRTFSDFLG